MVKLLTNAIIPMANMVTGSDVKQMRASSQPFISANTSEATKALWKLMNIGTFSPIPSSNFDKSLEK